MSPYVRQVNAAEDNSKIGNEKTLFAEMILYNSQSDKSAECNNEHGPDESMR